MLIDTYVLIWYMRGNEKAKHLIRNTNGFSIKNSAHNQRIGLCTDEICNYWQDLKESDDTFKRLKLMPVTIKFDPIVLKKIKMLANKRGISYNAYIRYLLAKSIEVEMIHQSLPRGTHGGTVISNKDNYLFKTHFFTITPSHHYCVQG